VAIKERETWTRESWTDRGEVADALAAFKGWHPQVGAIIGAVDETFIWALFDRAPLERWSVGRVTLLGDACHAMLPFMAQGAAQSIEDGATLATCLRQGGAADVASALRRYEALRRPRATRLQEMPRANKTRFHLPDGLAQQAPTPSWPRAATGRSRHSAGSTGTTLRRSTAIPNKSISVVAGAQFELWKSDLPWISSSSSTLSGRSA